MKLTHPIYAFDCGLDDDGTALSSLHTLLTLGLDDELIEDYIFEKQTIKHLVPFEFGEHKGKTTGRVVKVELDYGGK